MNILQIPNTHGGDWSDVSDGPGAGTKNGNVFFGLINFHDDRFRVLCLFGFRYASCQVRDVYLNTAGSVRPVS